MYFFKAATLYDKTFTTKYLNFKLCQKGYLGPRNNCTAKQLAGGSRQLQDTYGIPFSSIVLWLDRQSLRSHFLTGLLTLNMPRGTSLTKSEKGKSLEWNERGLTNRAIATKSGRPKDVVRN